MYYGLQVGLTYEQTMDIPIGLLLDLAAIHMIKHEGARRAGVLTDDDIIPDID